MNIQQWQQQVWDCPNMNPTAVAICLAIGSHGNWSEAKTVWPTRQRISGMTGVSRETVGQYMTALEEQGWLKVVKIRKDNIKEYELTKPEVAPVLGILAIKPRGGIKNLKSEVALSLDKQVDPTLDKQVVLSLDKGLSRVGTVTYQRTYQENLQEELTNTTTAPSAAVVKEDSLLEEDRKTSTDSLNFDTPHGDVRSAGAPLTSPPMATKDTNSANAPLVVEQATFNSRDMLEAWIGWTRPITDDEPFKARLKELTMDRTFEPEENRPNHRLQKAAERINEERGALL